MTKSLHVTSCIFALAGALTAAGCGKSSPTSPSTGATVSGVIRATTPAGLSVSVAGSGAATTTASNGTFSMAGVPAGSSVQLRITGNGTNATANLGQITENEEVDVDISVNGNSASVNDEKHLMGDGSAEIEGPISAVDATNRTVTIGSFTINVPSNVTFNLHGGAQDFTSLTVGLRIEARGTLQGNVLTATEIKADDDGGGE